MRDCALITRTASMHSAVNLRELRDRVEICPTSSLYHHFCETKLRPTFDDPEYPNDFAVWAAHALHDSVLAERLGMVNPYAYPNLEDLRAVCLDIIGDRLFEMTPGMWAQTTDQFHFLQAMTIVFDTGVKVENAPDLLPAVLGMSLGSIYFHFIEARRREPIGGDDFSAWLAAWGDEYADLIAALGQIDFYFLSLRELKGELVSILTRYLLPGELS